MRLFALLVFAAVVAPGLEAQDVRDTVGPLETRATAVSSDVPLPRRTFAEPVFYPVELRRIGGRGAVIFQVTLDDSGKVAEIRKTHGPLVQPSIGGISDPASLRAAADKVERFALASLKYWRFDAPVRAPLTFGISFAFVAGEIRIASAAAGETLPKELPPSRWAALELIPARSTALRGSVTPPKQTRKVMAIYPDEAQKAKVQGVVIMEVFVAANGKVQDARILRSVPLLDLASLEAVLQYEYEPLIIDGKPSPFFMTVTTTFKLN